MIVSFIRKVVARQKKWQYVTETRHHDELR